jgi:hypothetical protein
LRQLTNRGSDAAQQTATLGALHIGPGNGRKKSLDFNVEIVFDGQCDGVLQREIKLPRAYQTI